MKTRFKCIKTVLASLLCFSLLVSCSHTKEDEAKTDSANSNPILLVPTCLLPATGEILLDLNTHSMDSAKGNFEISEFKPTNIYTGNGVHLPACVNKINKEHFCKLRDSSQSIARQYPGNDSAVKALRIKFGLNSTHDTIVLIYQPVALGDPIITGDSVKFKVLEGNTPRYYTHTSTGFSEINPGQTCTAYMDYIMLKHSTLSAPSAFEKGKDVESVLYSFQEIGQLLQDNLRDTVTTWNAIGKKVKNTPGDSSYYHSVLLGPAQLNGPTNYKFYGPFSNKFANLAHLCPPNCSVLVFKIKR